MRSRLALARYWAAMTVVAGGVAVTLALAVRVDANTRSEQEDWLTTRGEVVVGAFERSVGDALNDLEALAAFMEAMPDVTIGDFRAFLERIGVDRGLVGVGFIPEVAAAERAAFERQMQAVFSGYQIRESVTDPNGQPILVRAPDRARYYPVQFFVPGSYFTNSALGGGTDLLADGIQFPIYDVNDALGVDIGSDPHWSVALEKAFVTGETAVSGFLPLAEIDLANVIFVYVPVLSPHGEVAGVVAAPVLDVLLGANLPGALAQEISWDVSTGPPTDVGPGAWQDALDVADRTWYFTVAARSGAAMPFGASPGRVVAIIGLAMTALLAITAQLALHWWRSRSRVRNLQQLSAEKDRFIAVVSHELRTPLTAAFGIASELVERGGELEPAEASDLLQIVADQTAEAGHIIEDLLVAARSDIDKLTIRPEHTDLQAAIAHVRFHMDGSQVEYVGGHASAWADPYRVRQIIRNLVTNAVRYGGDRIMVRCVQKPGVASVLVADDGEEIGPEARKEMFRPYTTGEHDRYVTGSMGLGLYISRGLARRMGGDIVYRHEDGLSVFELSLPAIPARAAASPPVESVPA